MTYKIKPTKTFEKNLKNLTAQEQRLVTRKLMQMMEDPYYPSLRTKKVQGFRDIFECSVNMDIRILWQYQGTDIIVTLDIGRHSLIDSF
jgi:mRNA-degrading endonuclease RelE of RelBE toxin-antitoxin system